MERLGKIIIVAAVVAFMLGGLWLTVRKDSVPEGTVALNMSSSHSLSEDQIKLYNEKHPDTYLRLTPGAGNVVEILTQTAAGAGPDLIGDIDENNILTYTNAGLLADLNSMLPDAALADTLEAHVRNSLSVPQLDSKGKLKTILAAYPASVQYLFVIYNKNIFDRANVPYPSEDLLWDEYIDKAKKLTLRHDNSRSPEIFGAIGVNPFALIWQHGGEMFNHAGTRCTLDSKAVADAMTFYHHLIHELQAEPIQAQSGTDEQPFRVELFTNGRLAMLWASRKIMTVLRKTIYLQQQRKDAWLKEHPGKVFPGPEPLRIGACLIPRFKDGQRFVNFSVDSIGVNAGSKHKNACREFISFLSSQTYADSLRENPVGVSGNKTFCSQEFMNNPLFPDEHEINRIALISASFARHDTPCYFVSTPYVMRSFQETRFKIATSPNMTPEHIKIEMKLLSNKINARIQHSIQREKHLKKLYDTLNQP